MIGKIRVSLFHWVNGFVWNWEDLSLGMEDKFIRSDNNAVLYILMEKQELQKFRSGIGSSLGSNVQNMILGKQYGQR